jgi:AraC-like DNA-binding protein
MIKVDVIRTDLAHIWANLSDEPRNRLHCHAEYEIYYITQGDVDFRVEGRLYKPSPESILLIPPNYAHGDATGTTKLYHHISVHFLPELIDDAERDFLLSLYTAPNQYYPDLSTIRIDALVQSIMDCKAMESPFLGIALKYRIVTLLTHIYQVHTQDMGKSAPRDKRIQMVLVYLNNNLREHIKLDQLAGKFNINKDYLNEIFHREMGTTINQYLRVKRLVLASQELRKGTNAEEAAYRSGFNDYSNFYRAYKAYFGVKPSAYAGEEWKINPGISTIASPSLGETEEID